MTSTSGAPTVGRPRGAASHGAVIVAVWAVCPGVVEIVVAWAACPGVVVIVVAGATCPGVVEIAAAGVACPGVAETEAGAVPPGVETRDTVDTIHMGRCLMAIVPLNNSSPRLHRRIATQDDQQPRSPQRSRVQSRQLALNSIQRV